MAVLPQQHAITDALGDVRDGVPGALDRLIPLVSEAYLQLVDAEVVRP